MIFSLGIRMGLSVQGLIIKNGGNSVLWLYVIFVERVRTEIKNIKPDIQLEYWAASWIHAIYGQGQNWASTEYDFSKEYSWASSEYKNAGFAGLLDTLLCGT